MAFNGQQPENLDEQLRRMILSNPAAPTSYDSSSPPNGFHPPHHPPASAPFGTQRNFSYGDGPMQGSMSGPPPVADRNFPQNAPPMNGYGHTNNGYPQAGQNGASYTPERSFHRAGPQGMPRQHQQRNNHQAFFNNPAPHQRSRFQQQMPLDPDAFQRRNFGPPTQRHGAGQNLFNPNAPQGIVPNRQADHILRQAQYLDQLAATVVSSIEMPSVEIKEKEAFRSSLEQLCHEVCKADPMRLPKVLLECFGSFKSGFATAGSDMDLAIVIKDNAPTSACFSLHEDYLPRVLEKRLLQLGYGARLLTKTRVPIIKVCEKPDAALLDKLREERERWDDLPEEARYPHLHTNIDEAEDHVETPNTERGVVDSKTSTGKKEQSAVDQEASSSGKTSSSNLANNEGSNNGTGDVQSGVNGVESTDTNSVAIPKRDEAKPWTRERKAGPLDFPNSGVGIQSDINFFNPLGLHNTQLLRCYSLCDARVRPFILFIKAWAKRRKINSSYSGTLSSYGYVLMVLHYLVNVAQPPVLPNLQSMWRPSAVQPADSSSTLQVEGWAVFFWGDDIEIVAAAQRGLLTTNQESLGSLLAGFFQYYASQGGGPTFRWTTEILSLRTVRGGILSKEEKGWVKAMTEESEGKKVQHRYLFAIEDPFELNHNVARTVTHNGIVAIRDEFRRAKRILHAVGNGWHAKDGDLFAQLVEAEGLRKATEEMKGNVPQNGVPGGFARKELPLAPAPQTNGLRQHTPLNGANRKASTPRGQAPVGRSPNGNPRVGMSKKAFDVGDNDAFPTLGGAKPTGKKKQLPVDDGRENFSEISGDKAKIVLEGVKRKKDEAHAERTATSAAEAVLGDSD